MEVKILWYVHYFPLVTKYTFKTLWQVQFIAILLQISKLRNQLARRLNNDVKR